MGYHLVYRLMDKYSCKWPLWFAQNGSKTNAVTIGQTTYYSEPESAVTASWRAHEDCHKEQWKSEGRVKFAARYLWQFFTKGYDKVDYEVAAVEASKKDNQGV
jgi:hypothetical protein